MRIMHQNNTFYAISVIIILMLISNKRKKGSSLDETALSHTRILNKLIIFKPWAFLACHEVLQQVNDRDIVN